MPQSKLNQLQEAIIERVPEIRELKFGCKVLIKDSANYAAVEITIDNGMTVYPEHNALCMDGNLFYPISDQDQDNMVYIDKIIGRDITLADVLLAISETPRAVGHSNIRIGYVYGDFLVAINVGKQFFWKPDKPLHLQDEETIDFLHDVICQKK